MHQPRADLSAHLPESEREKRQAEDAPALLKAPPAAEAQPISPGPATRAKRDGLEKKSLGASDRPVPTKLTDQCEDGPPELLASAKKEFQLPRFKDMIAARDSAPRSPRRLPASGLAIGGQGSALSGYSQGSGSSPRAELAPQYKGLGGMVNMDSALRIQMAIRQKKQDAQRAQLFLEPSALSTLEEQKEESLQGTMTSSAQWELERREDLNSELDLWSDHPSAYD